MSLFRLESKYILRFAYIAYEPVTA